MKKAKRLLVTSVVFGVLSFGLFVFERLALTDIYHGEPDLSLEWNIVSVSFFPILLFHIISVVAAVVALRKISNRKVEPTSV